MVEHRADHSPGLHIFGSSEDDAGWPRSSVREQLNDWMAMRPRLFRPGELDRLVGIYRWPLILSAAWLLLVVAYGIGFFGTRSAGDAPSPLASMEMVVFFVSALGPLAVLWITAILVRRIARLGDVIAGQSDTALALAATVANLQDSVDDLADASAVRMDASLRNMESRVAGSVSALDDSVTAALEETRLSIAVRGGEIDTLLDETRERLSSALGARIGALDSHLKDGAEKLEQMNAAQQDRISARLQKAMEAVEASLAERASALGERLLEADREVAEGIDRRADSLAEAMRKAQESQATRLDEAAARLEKTMTHMQGRISRALDARASQIDKMLSEESERLGTAMHATAQIVDGDLRKLLSDVGTALKEASGSIAANPPASAEELTDLLGATAAEMIAPERQVLVESAARLERVEETARKLIARVDRATRLSAPDRGVAETLVLTSPVGLFEDLPTCASSEEVSWPAVIVALDLRDPDADEAMDKARNQTAKVPTIERLLRLADKLDAGLREDGLYIEELRIEPASAAAWRAFAEGRRGSEVARLAGIRDEVALGLARSSLRRDPEVRADALRMIGLYTDMVQRASSELGTEAPLVEMSDTTVGRAFQLYGHLNGAFDRLPEPTTLLSS